MIVRCGARWTTTALLALVILATACVHHAAISQDYGLPGRTASQQKKPKPDTASSTISQQAVPDTSLRTIFRQQTEGAFNPLTDDPHVRTLQSRLKLTPQDAAARLELAAIYENYRLHDQAFEQYADTLRLVLATPAARDDHGGRAQQAATGLGRCARASGRAREAIPLMELFVVEWPAPAASTWNELGLLYDEAGDFGSGESALRTAVTREPQSDWLHNNLGYNLLLQNKTEAAESEFRRALELNPKSAATRNNMGTVLARRGDLDGALEQFQLAADPATAHNNLAVVLLEAGLYEQSRDELVKALAIHRNFGPALANFKLVHERIRQRAELPKRVTPAGEDHSSVQQKTAESKQPEEKQ